MVTEGGRGRQTAKQHSTRLSKEPCPLTTCVYRVYTSTQAGLNTTKLRLTKASGITTRRRCHLKTFRIANLLRKCQIGKTESGCRDTQSFMMKSNQYPEESPPEYYTRGSTCLAGHAHRHIEARARAAGPKARVRVEALTAM